MNFVRIIFLALLSVFCFQSIGLGQNLVQDFQVRVETNNIRLVLQATNEFQYELLPFDSQTYTLVKLYPLQFPVETKNQMLSPLEILPLKLQALELMDQSVMFSFKGVLARQITIKSGENHRTIEIVITLILADQHSAGERTKGQSAGEYYQTAVSLVARTNYSAALSALHQALKLQPNYAAAFLLAGKIRFQQQKWQKAKYNLNRAHQLAPNLVEAQSYLAKIETILNPKNEDNQTFLPAKTKITNADRDSTTKLPKPKSPITTTELDSFAFSSAPKITDSTLTSNSVKQITPAENNITLARSGRTNYVQTGLFLMIILSIVIWFAFLWYKRSLLKQSRPSVVPDFANLLQKIQNQSPILGTDMPEFHPTVSPTDSDTSIASKIKNATNSPPNGVRENNIVRSRLPKSSLPSIEPDYFSEMAKQTQREGMEQKILHYAEMGFSVDEIARRTQLGKGEVQLVLNLHGRDVPMSAPEVRIQME